MRSWRGRSAAIAMMLAASCSLTSFDDIQGGTRDAGNTTCIENVDCSGCQSCLKRCQCTNPASVDTCFQSQCSLLDAAGDNGGASGSSGSGGSGGSTGGSSGSGGSTGGGSGSGGGTAGAAPGCEGVQVGTPSCTTCAQEKCCGELAACAAGPCVALNECLATYCVGATDIDACMQQNCSAHMAGLSALSALSTCISDKCAAECA